MIDCIEFADAPFCKGESLKACGYNIEVPEDEACPPLDPDPPVWANDTIALGAVPDEEMYSSCEIDGTCDDSCSAPARDDCLITEQVEPAPPVEPMLPQTGITDPGLLLVTGLAAIIAGLRLRRIA